MKKQSRVKRLSASFRDNDGFLFEKEGKLFRQVNKSYQKDYDFFQSSGLYKELVNKELLIPHKEVSLQHALNNDAYKILQPQKVDFISYPYEWCFSQLKEAALTTLKIQEIALGFGMSLKDASGFNIQFEGKPIFVDSLSFETLESKPWVAYRQFCQHFLNPLALMSKVDLSLNRLLSIYLDGIPTDLTSKLLPLVSKLYPNFFLHIQLHSIMQKKSLSKKDSKEPKQSSFSKKALLGLVGSLEATINNLKPPKMDSIWSSYTPEKDSYTPTAFKDKERIVSKLYMQTKARKVWDLGSNIGYFSRLLGNFGAQVYSFDSDALSVEKNYLLSKDQSNILPLVLDLTNPSPSLGWAGRERESIFKRGNPDMILALALIHHLVIGSNTPFELVAEQFSSLCQFLIMEFIPKEDPQVKKLLYLREDIFVNYNQATFEKTFEKYFKILSCIKVKDSLRKIYLMKLK